MDLKVRIKHTLRFATWILACGNLLAQTEKHNQIRLHYERAQEAMRVNELDKATQEFREILRLDPSNAEVHANLGLIAFTQARYSEAARAFREALNLHPSLWNAKAWLGMSEVRLGHASEGRKLLEESSPHLQDVRLRKQVGMDLMRIQSEAGDFDHAVSTLRTVQQEHPNDADVLYLSYRVYSALATRALTSLSKVAPGSAHMHQLLAETLANQDNFLGAVTQYRKALEIDPSLPGLHFELGQTILLNSRDEAARQQAQKAFEAELASNPADSNSEHALGEIYWLRSNWEEALHHESRALELRPDFAEAQIGVAKILTAMEQPENALEHLLEAVRIDPENEVAHHRLALLYRRLGRSADADREQATFERLRDSHTPIRSLLQEILQGPVTPRTTEHSEPR